MFRKVLLYTKRNEMLTEKCLPIEKNVFAMLFLFYEFRNLKCEKLSIKGIFVTKTVSSFYSTQN